MSKNDALQNAINLVRSEISGLAEKINNTPVGDERTALETRMKELTDSIGFKWEGLPTGDAPKTAEVKLTLIQRFKLSYSANKKKYWAGLATILGLAAGAAYYFVKVKNTQATVSSVLGMAETAAGEAAPETADTTATETTVGIFTRIGDAILKGGSAAKHFLVNAYHTVVGFAKNLFTKSTTTEGTDVGNNEAVLGAEAVPA